MNKTYMEAIRELAQSILAGTQRLDEHGATEDDESFAQSRDALVDADNAVWALVDWIEEGRPDGI